VTVEAATGFVKRLAEDKAVQAEIAAAIAGIDGALEQAQKVAAIAKRHGFDCVPQEVLAVRLALRPAAADRPAPSQHELTGEDLQNVSGGRSTEYDGFAEFPRYPVNVLADLNAVLLHELWPLHDPKVPSRRR